MPRPQIELLEDRITPALFGVPWPDASHLSLSLVPDGTDVDGQTSQLFRILDTNPGWQREVLRAFQTWAVLGNVNLHVVDDSGLALGTTGAIQGDDRFGDIRVSAIPLPSDALALALPFDYLAGTRSGDVTLNADALAAGQHDLFALMLHEAGHVFGLPHVSEPHSPRYATYQATAGLTAEDISRFQALYGTRSEDAQDARHRNDTRSSATLLASVGLPGPARVWGDLTTLQDRDWYKFRTGNTGGSYRITLEVSQFSLLAARVTVVDAGGEVVASARAEGVPGSDLTLDLDRLRPSSTYYLRVDADGQDVFGIGRYRLTVSAAGSSRAPESLPPPPDAATTARNAALVRKAYRSDPRFDYYAEGSLLSGENRVHRIQISARDLGGDGALTVMVWLGRPAGQATVTLTDAAGRSLDAQVLVKDFGIHVLQLSQDRFQGVYQVAISIPSTVAGSDYFLAVDITASSQAETFVDRQEINEAAPQARTLLVAESQWLQRSRAVDPGPAGSFVELTILDGGGQVVGILTAAAGDTASRTVFLPAGIYGFIFRVHGAPTLTCTLYGRGISDPIGPSLIDPTLTPTEPSTTTPTTTTTTTTTSTTTSTTYSTWWDAGYYSYLWGDPSWKTATTSLFWLDSSWTLLTAPE